MYPNSLQRNQMQDWIIDCCNLGAHLLQSPGWTWWNPMISYVACRLWLRLMNLTSSVWVGKLWKKGGIASHGSQFFFFFKHDKKEKRTKWFGSWSGLSRYCFPLLQPRTAVWVSWWWQKLGFEKPRPWFLVQVFQKQLLKPFSFPRRPEASQMVGRCIPVWDRRAAGPTGSGPDTCVGVFLLNPFEIKWDTVHD